MSNEPVDTSSQEVGESGSRDADRPLRSWRRLSEHALVCIFITLLGMAAQVQLTPKPVALTREAKRGKDED